MLEMYGTEQLQFIRGLMYFGKYVRACCKYWWFFFIYAYFFILFLFCFYSVLLIIKNIIIFCYWKNNYCYLRYYFIPIIHLVWTNFFSYWRKFIKFLLIILITISNSIYYIKLFYKNKKIKYKIKTSKFNLYLGINILIWRKW